MSSKCRKYLKKLLVAIIATNLVVPQIPILANINNDLTQFSLPSGINTMEDVIRLILMLNGGVFNQNAASMLLSILGIPVTTENIDTILNIVLSGTNGNNTEEAIIPFFNNFAYAGPETLIQAPSNNNFSNIIRDNVSLSTRVVDIAILGSHNSFSNGINSNSDIDPMYGNDLVYLAPGFASRFGRTQYGNAMDLLNNGIRYLDVRVSNVNGNWYIENTMLSNSLSYYVSDVILFLQQNKGEIIIFDLQHIVLGNASSEEFWNYLSTIRVNGQNLFDFININPNTDPLGYVTLANATNNGTSAGVVMLANQPTSQNSLHYFRDENIRSKWLQQDNVTNLITEIEKEQTLVGDGRYSNRLRVNQASLALSTSGEGLLTAISSWSYMYTAERTNTVLLTQDINRWLSVTPIMMVGFAEASYSNFNEQVINIINSFNRNLN
ncbi:MAG: hypothetical protein FWF57_03340 [Defluviitaleaceae bacterium]|nr:hypothetical protein [Defluviitaleaceae bacterium]